jgi:hypothetical protein
MLSSKFIIMFVSFIIVASPIYAGDVAVLITFPDGSVHGQCINAPIGINGYELLQELSLETIWSVTGSFGHQLCEINGVGDEVSGNTCSYSGKYWGFFTYNNNWEYMPVGFDGGHGCWNGDLTTFNGHYCSNDKDLLGFRYGTFGEFPLDFSYSDICHPLSLMDVKVYVDKIKEAGVNERGGKIKARPNSEITFKIEIKNNYLFDDNLKLENIEAALIIEAIDDEYKKKIEFNNLEVGEKSRAPIEFKLPKQIIEGDYEIKLILTAETDGGIEQEIEIDYDLEVERKLHKIVIADLILTNNVSCIGNNNGIYLKVANLGREDEEDVWLSIYNDELGLNFTDKFDLKRSEDFGDINYRKNLSFEIPLTANTGYHPIQISLDYRENIYEKIDLFAKDCSYESSHDEFGTENSNSEVILQNSASNPTIIINRAIPSVTNSNTKNYNTDSLDNFLEKNIVPILLGAFLSILIAIISFIIVILHKE